MTASAANMDRYEARRGEARRGEETRGEERKGEAKRGEERTGEERSEKTHYIPIYVYSDPTRGLTDESFVLVLCYDMLLP